MDEPTNGLDPNQLIEARKLIREIGQDRVVLLSSDIMSEIHLLCKEVIMIEAGRIVFSDTMHAFNNYVQPHSLVLRMENPPPASELLTVPGITRAETMADRQIRLWFDGEEDITERLVAMSVQHGWRLREISLDKGLLDDVFKELSAQAR